MEDADHMSKPWQMRCMQDNRNIWLKKEQRDRYRDRRLRDREKTVACDHEFLSKQPVQIFSRLSTYLVISVGAQTGLVLSAQSLQWLVQLEFFLNIWIPIVTTHVLVLFFSESLVLCIDWHLSLAISLLQSQAYLLCQLFKPIKSALWFYLM